MVATFFEHLQKPHDQPRSGEHKDLEIDIYRWPSPDLTGRCAGKLCGPVKCELLSPLDPRNSAKASFMVDGKRSTACLLPDDYVFFWNILRFPRLDFTVNTGCIKRRRYAEHHVGGGKFVSEVRLHDDEVCDLRSSNLVDGGDHAHRQFYI
jgi:hypothetical protein